MRQKIAIKSSVIGISTRIITIVLSLITTRLFLKYLGIEIKGINGLINNILSLLQLAEMGIGTAIIYALYQPIVEDNQEEICSLMALYKKAYNYIGLFVIGIGSIVSLFLRFIIEDATYGWDYIYIIYFIQLIAASATYFVGAYRRNLLYADQKQYITVIVDAIANIIFSLCRIVIIVVFKSYLLYLLMQILQTVCSNTLICIYTNKQYPYIKNSKAEKYDKVPELVSNIKHVVVGKVGGVIYNSTDSILITKFVGVIAVGYMTNYYTLRSMIKMIVSSVTDPIKPMIGNFVREYNDVSKSFQLFLSYSFIRFVIANFITVGFVSLCNPLIDLWLGHEYNLPVIIPILIATDLFIDIVHGPTWEFNNVLGFFKSNRNMALGGAAINLFSSIFLVQVMGTEGVLIGTVIAQMYYWMARAFITFSHFFHQGVIVYIWRVLSYTVITVIDIMVVVSIRRFVMPETDILHFIIMCAISVFVSATTIVVFWHKSVEFSTMISIIGKLFTKTSSKRAESQNG